MKFNLKMPVSNEQIKKEVSKLEAELKKRQSEIDLLRKAIDHYQGLCKHPGQKTGHNERDGSWGNPCPVCGYSY